MKLTGSLRQRLTRFILLTLGAAGIVIALVEALSEFYARQESFVENIEVLMDITTESLDPFIAARDAQGAGKHLRELIVRPDILAARIRWSDGSLFAENVLAPQRLAELPPPPPPRSTYTLTGMLWGDAVVLSHAIKRQGREIGSLELHVDLRPLWRAQGQRLLWIVLALLTAWGIAYWIARRFEGQIIGPIGDLERAVRDIAASRRYDVRVKRTTDDELGRLVDHFNEMLVAIADSDEELRRRSDALDRQSSLLRTLIGTLPDLVWFKNPQGEYLTCNPRFEGFFGARAVDIIGKTDADFVSAELAAELRALDQAAIERGAPTVSEQHALFAADGHREELEITVTPMYGADGRLLGVVGIGHDITERQEHKRHLEHIANHDTLTGLPNRVMLSDRLRQAMALCRRQNGQLAVVYLDLDGFKAINDRHGHNVGDQLLSLLAARLLQALRKGDTLARFGGDEFVAVLVDLKESEATVAVLKRLLAAAATPVKLEGRELQVSASIGVSFFPQAETVDADQLLRQADQAMYQAKQTGKNCYAIFDPEQDRRVRGRHESLDRIRQALAHQEFVLHYQPKVNMRSGEVIGVEALIRWQHPEEGLLAPAAFLPLIEDNSLAIAVDEWVFETALQQTEAWRRAGLALPVSVNVFALHLQQPNFLAGLRAILARHPGFQTGDLEIEVLESSALEDLANISQVIRSCRELGVGFAMDDFGTGYSSLTYLKQLPARVLKIDQSFVRGVLDDSDNLAILRSVLDLAFAFRRNPIAEGVETVEHGRLLLQLGCELAQGYAIARPMPAAAVPGWLADWRPAAEWTRCPRIAPDAMPVLYAAIDHRAWVAQLQRYLEDSAQISPPADCHKCNFGSWLDEQRDGPDAAILERIVALHETLHRLAAELMEMKQAGQGAAAQARFGEITALRDGLLGELRQLADPGLTDNTSLL